MAKFRPHLQFDDCNCLLLQIGALQHPLVYLWASPVLQISRFWHTGLYVALAASFPIRTDDRRPQLESL